MWKQLISCHKQSNNKHWLEYSKDSYSNSIINDTKKTLHMLRLYIPLSMFWSLFDQQNTTWIFQASRTSDHLFGIKFSICMLQMINPLLVLFSIPFMSSIIYPYLNRHKLFKYPLKRMLLGGSITGIAFIFAGCIEMYLEKNSQNMSVPRKDGIMYLADVKPCLMKTWTSNLGFQKCNETGYFVENNIAKYIHENSVNVQIVKSKNDKEMIKVRLKQNMKSIFLLFMETENNSFKNYSFLFNLPTVLIPENVYTTIEKNHSSMYIVFPESNSDNWLQIKSLTLESMFTNKTTIYEKTFPVRALNKTKMLQIRPGLYTLTINYMNNDWQSKTKTVLNLDTDKMFVYERIYNNKTNSNFQTNTTDSKSYLLNKEWLLPQFVLMAFGETLFTMTGLAFSFSEAPETMKTVSISMWYFSVATGNMIVIFIHKTIVFEKRSHVFFVFVFNTLLAIVVTYKMSNTFEKLYNDEKESDEKNVDLVTLLKKESYQLSF